MHHERKRTTVGAATMALLLSGVFLHVGRPAKAYGWVCDRMSPWIVLGEY